MPAPLVEPKMTDLSHCKVSHVMLMISVVCPDYIKVMVLDMQKPSSWNVLHKCNAYMEFHIKTCIHTYIHTNATDAACILILHTHTIHVHITHADIADKS